VSEGGDFRIRISNSIYYVTLGKVGNV